MPSNGQDSGGKLDAVRPASVFAKHSVLTWLQLHGEIGDQVPASVVGVVVNFILNAYRLLVIMNLAASHTCDLHWLLESLRNQGQAVVRFLLVLIVQSLCIQNHEFVFNAECDIEPVAC